jgi:3-phenylpropionate/trans-cinnamate dioxygenase ferredoxin reductase component
MTPAPRITIVGASLAGLRTAEAVLSALPGARVTLVGAEREAPYNRPPLSKDAAEALSGAGVDAAAVFDKLALKSRLSPDDVTLRLDVSAEAVEPDAVRFSDGTSLRHDWLVAATGLRPRRLPLKGGEDRRFVLRTFADALRLGHALRPGARMVVAGGGFIGCEIAATARKIGLHVTIVEPMEHPMIGALGPRVAAAMAALHRSHGVTVLTGRSVTAIAEGEPLAILNDGQALEADLVVEALGSHPNIEWLAGTGADLSDGVLCDNRLLAPGAERLLAVGDVARFVNPLFGPEPRRVEHWCVPGQTARRAAETIAARVAGKDPAPGFAPMPSFWSDQHGMRLQSFGAPALADSAEVIDGDLGQTGAAPVIVEYRREGRPVAILGLGVAPAALASHRARLDRALSPETVQ